MIEEVKRTLKSEKFNLAPNEIAFLSSYEYRSLRVYANPSPSEIRKRKRRLDDEKDLPVLTGFEELDCQFLVTGDKEMLTKVKRAIRTTAALRAIERDLQAATNRSEPQDT